MTQPDKLTIKAAEEFIKLNKNRFGSEKAVSVCQQLIGTLRENEKLRKSMLDAYDLVLEGEIFEATAILKIIGENKENDHIENLHLSTDNT